MARNVAPQINFQFIDRSSEIAGFTLYTAGTVDQTDTLPAQLVSFQTALDAITDMPLIRRTVTVPARVSNIDVGTGQREDKYLVVYEDTTTLSVYTTEIPGRNIANAGQTVQGTDNYDLAVAPWAAFVTAFEAFAVSPDGNPINVLRIQAVGRNI